MMAKAVANNTKAAFIHVVGSEFVQKYLGEVTYFHLLPVVNQNQNKKHLLYLCNVVVCLGTSNGS
jgi:hypothetical protein